VCALSRVAHNQKGLGVFDKALKLDSSNGRRFINNYERYPVNLPSVFCPKPEGF